MTQISILDLVRIREGGSARASLDAARDLAAHAENWGYTRFWMAEHHGMRGIASAATALAIQHVAAGTRTIRVGAGGIMLPNHSPLLIAEQFGTLDALFPGRIDLGVGRAPGTDQLTWRAMRRDPRASDMFPQDVQELIALLAPAQDGQRLIATPGAGSQVPVWVLGSSLFGAELAGRLGLPYAFASHFAPAALLPALATYRAHFTPSGGIAAPHAAIGVNIVAAATDAEARRLATTQQMSIADLFRGARGLSQPPIDDIDSYWTLAEKMQAQGFLSRSIVGSEATVARGMAALIAETGADELVVVSDVFDHDARLASYAAIARAAIPVALAAE